MMVALENDVLPRVMMLLSLLLVSAGAFEEHCVSWEDMLLSPPMSSMSR